MPVSWHPRSFWHHRNARKGGGGSSRVYRPLLPGVNYLFCGGVPCVFDCLRQVFPCRHRETLVIFVTSGFAVSFIGCFSQQDHVVWIPPAVCLKLCQCKCPNTAGSCSQPQFLSGSLPY